MNARYNGEKWTIEMTAQRYEEMVKRFFNENPFPSCDELKYALVPNGIPNTAEGKERRFGANGIFKYEFVSSDGIFLMVKYHGVDTRVLEMDPESNAAKGWTAQIICNFCSYFSWIPEKKSAQLVTVSCKKALSGVAPRLNSVHIPLRSGPDFAPKD